MDTASKVFQAIAGGATVDEIVAATGCPRLDVEQYLYFYLLSNRVKRVNGVYYVDESNAA